MFLKQRITLGTWRKGQSSSGTIVLVRSKAKKDTPSYHKCSKYKDDRYLPARICINRWAVENEAIQVDISRIVAQRV
jgi:hypothetical protein